MRKQLAKRLDLVATKRGVDEPLFIRLVTILRPDLPEEDQDRWLALAEHHVDEELQRLGKRRIVLWSHVESPALVAVDGPAGRFLVQINDNPPVPTARIVERKARRFGHPQIRSRETLDCGGS